MGVVYRARRDGAVADEHDVALKVIAAGPDASLEALARFQREARIAQELDHPGIVKVLETGESDGQVWFAMELIEGEPLSKQIKEREFTWQEAVTIVRDVADALAVAHDKGVLHRDIKPSNILMDAGDKPHIADFGLAKDTRTESKYTRTGQTLGTPAYMSPEQARGNLADLSPASDVWALGCVLYELLANRPAFEGDTVAAVIGAVMTAAPDFRGLPRPPQQLCAVCLQRQAPRRYSTAAELRRDCDRVLDGREPAVKLRGQGARFLATAAAGLALVSGVAWLALIGNARAPSARKSSESVGESQAEGLATRGWKVGPTEPAEGADLLEQALRLDPNRHEWRIERGLLLWAIGRNSEAREAWERVPADASESPRAGLYLGLESLFQRQGAGGDHLEMAARAEGRTGRLARGALAMGTNRWAEARAELQGIGGWEAALLRGMVEMGDPAGSPERCEREYGTALGEGIVFAWALNNRASIRVNSLGDAAGALTDCNRALELDPRLAHAWVTRGVARHALGQFEQALADFGQAIGLEPRLVVAWMNRGRTRMACGDLSGAVADYRVATDLEPRRSGAWVRLGDAQREHGDFHGAAESFGCALEIEPKSLSARAGRARTRAENGDPRGAIADYSVLIDLDPREAEMWYCRGLARHSVGDLPGAIEDYGKVLELDPAHPKAWNNRGNARTALGDFAGAALDFGRAIERDPAAAQPRLNRGLARDQAGDAAGAIADFTKALELDSTYAKAWAARGRTRWKSGDLPGAEADMSTGIKLNPKSVAAWANRGFVRHQRGNLSGAAEDLGTALKITPPNHPARKQIHSRLTQIRAALAARSGR